MWGRVHARVEIDGNDVSGKLTRFEINKGQDTSTGALRSAYPAQVSVQLLDEDSEYNILNPSWTELEIGSEVDIDLAIAQSHQTAAGGEYAVFDDERLVMGNDRPIWGSGFQYIDTWQGTYNRDSSAPWATPEGQERILDVIAVGPIRRLVGASATLPAGTINSTTAVNSILDQLSIPADARAVSGMGRNVTVAASGGDVPTMGSAVELIQAICDASGQRFYETRAGQIAVQPLSDNPTVYPMVPYRDVTVARGSQDRIYTRFNGHLVRLTSETPKAPTM